MKNYSLSVVLRDTSLIIHTGDKTSIEKLYKSWKLKIKQAWVEVPHTGGRMFLRSSEILALHMYEMIDQKQELTNNPNANSFIEKARFTDDVLLTDMGYK